jgi:hypothetical protein
MSRLLLVQNLIYPPPAASQALEDSADVIDKLIGQLESVLHDPETDPNKRKMAEFKLPDSNNDDMISRQEVCPPSA